MPSPAHELQASLLAAAPPASRAELGDLRFRALLGAAEWARLPAAVRRRFSTKAYAGQSLVFVGQVTESRMSWIGWVLAQVCRLIGGPLPTGSDTGVASVVTITDDAREGGQIWTRLYSRGAGFPQVIHSAKRFAGPTGLEEHLGYGVGMTLAVAVEAESLVFRSVRYFFEIAGWRFYLPDWLTPGRLTVRHTPIDQTRFVFSLAIDHRRFGRILHQAVQFEEHAK
jgi:hypothetical protein